MSAGANGRIAVNSGSRGLDAFEAAVLALNLPASSGGVNYQFSQGSFICVPNLYSSSGVWPAILRPAHHSSPWTSLLPERQINTHLLLSRAGFAVCTCLHSTVPCLPGNHVKQL